VTESDVLRRLAQAFDDITMWRNFVAIMPWTVHVDHEAERSRERAAKLLGRIPTQRLSLDTRLVPVGPPARPNTVWGTRSARR
jgi:hypothetical protein